MREHTVRGGVGRRDTRRAGVTVTGTGVAFRSPAAGTGQGPGHKMVEGVEVWVS